MPLIIERILGTQLQEANITSLKKYQTARNKEQLVEQYLYSVVQACGEENEEIGNLILYLLTDERGTRPLKTREELLEELTEKALTQTLTIESSQLDLVLDILVKSGLVVMIRAQPDDRYQLLHDYLTSVIRNKAPNIKKLLAKYNKEKAQRQALEGSLQQMQKRIEAQKATKKELETQNRKAKRQVQDAAIKREKAQRAANVAQAEAKKAKDEQQKLEAQAQTLRQEKQRLAQQTKQAEQTLKATKVKVQAVESKA